MKTTHVLTILATALGFGLAQAQEATPRERTNVVVTKTRAEVRAEAAGLVQAGEATRFVEAASRSALTREQVLAEAREAARLGAIAHGEYGKPPTPQQLSASSRRAAAPPCSDRRAPGGVARSRLISLRRRC